MRFWKRKEGGSFSFAAWSRKARAVLPLAVGILLTVLAVSVARQRIDSLEREIRERNEPVEIVVADRAIPAGASLSGEVLARKAIPASGAGRRNVPATEFERVLGSRVREEIGEGEPLLWSDLEHPGQTGNLARSVPEGRRAITVDADSRSSFAGLLRPGDRLDILQEPESGKGFRPLLYDVPVLAVDRQLGQGGEDEAGPEISTLTLSILPTDGIRLAHAIHNGKIHYLLRNPDDRFRPPKSPRPVRKRNVVEIWKGGLLQERVSIPAGETS